MLHTVVLSAWPASLEDALTIPLGLFLASCWLGLMLWSFPQDNDGDE